MRSLDELPLVGLGGDPTYLRLVSKQSERFGNRPGSLLNEYPFTFSIASYLEDCTAVLDQLVRCFQSEGYSCGTLRAVHFRLEAVSRLVSNRISII